MEREEELMQTVDELNYDLTNAFKKIEQLKDSIKQAREEILRKIGEPVCGEYIKQGHDWGLREALTIIDNLIKREV